MENKEILFTRLISGNQERIFRICAYHTSSGDDCSDLYQQVLINIWQSLGTFRGDSAINTWIYRVAINTAIDFTRSENRRRKSVARYLDEYESIRTRLESGYDKIRQEHLLDEMWRQINQLSVIDKVIITLVLEELPSKEIADIVGITDASVRVKVHRIKENLKLKMGEPNDE